MRTRAAGSPDPGRESHAGRSTPGRTAQFTLARADQQGVTDLEPLARRGDRDFDAEFSRAVAAFHAREAEHQASRLIWLAHHWPEEYDRCLLIRGHHVCRRCLLLYPLALAVAFGSLAGMVPWPPALDMWFIWGLCIPATLDFVAEQTGLIPYSTRRQTLVTILLAPALGRGFAHELENSWSWEFWGPVLVFCTLWFASAVAGRSGPTGGRAGERAGGREVENG